MLRLDGSATAYGRNLKTTDMKTLLAMIAITLGVAAQQTPAARDHTAWITTSLKTMQTIKPGMTRQDLLKVFTTEGGISNRLHRTYVFRECPYIKVDVDFKPVGRERDLLWESPADSITAISRPYLNWSVVD